MAVYRAKMKRFILLLFTLFYSTICHAENFGSFFYYNEAPNVLFLTDEIKAGDSFELRRALRYHKIDLIVTSSPGGNVYEGLQIASIINDKNLATYVPDAADCASACSMVFLGGVHRVAVGELGVHQFYSSSQTASDPERQDLTTALTQYTTGEIIGILNEFNTPPFVYEKMLSTIDMYYFSQSEKDKFELDFDGARTKSAVKQANNLVKRRPEVLRRRDESAKAAANTLKAPSTTKTYNEPAFDQNHEEFDGIDFFGNDIYPKGLRGISLNECQQVCETNTKCAAWSYVRSTQWCWPKTGVSNISLADGIVSGIVNFELVDQRIFDRPFLEATAVDIPGQDFFPNGLRGLSLDQCRNACLSTKGCVAWSYLPKKSACFPKYGTVGSEERIGVISGVRTIDD